MGWVRSGAATASSWAAGCGEEARPQAALAFSRVFKNPCGFPREKGTFVEKGVEWEGRACVPGAPPKEEGGLPCGRACLLSGCSSAKFEKHRFFSPAKKGFILKCEGSHQKPVSALKWKKSFFFLSTIKKDL